MKRLFILYVVLFCECICPIGLYAERVSIKVGIYNNEPLIFVDEEKGKGIFADILEYVASEEGWQIEYVPGNWKECLSRLENDQIDILSTIAYSKDRDELFDFNKENLLTNWGQLYRSIGSEIRAIPDISGKKVAILKGDLHQGAFIELIDNFGIECEIIEVDDYHTVLRMVSEGEADAGVVNRFFGMKYGPTYNVDTSGVIFNPINIHYAVPEGKNKELIAAIDGHIKLLKDDEKSTYYLSLDKWFGVISSRKTLPPWFKWAIAVALGVVLLLFLGNLLLRNRVKAKTQELILELNRRAEIEKALQEANNIINRSPAVAFLWRNREGWPVEFVSENVKDLFGFTAEEFTSGQISYGKTVHPDDLERVTNEVAISSNGVKKSRIYHKPYRVISKNGQVKWLDDRTYIRRHINGNITHYEGIVIDITESIKTGEALRENKKKLARSKKMEALGLLAGGVAHDLNNVLSGIVSYPELILLDLPKDSQYRETITTIKESGDRAVAIVQDLLTVARGVATITNPLNLNGLIDDYLDSPEFKKLKHFHPAVVIKTNLADDLLNITGSYVHIRKVVMNLVSNGSEAINGSGVVTITTTNRYVDSALSGYEDIVEGEYVVLAISDNGSGISSEEVERIFEPFYSKKFMGRSGTGLGLAVVWNVVQDHQGYIDVISDANGTTFEIYFPITREEVSEDDSAVQLIDMKGNEETVLVVDDIDSQREISCKMLETLGYKAISVVSGEEAIEYLTDNSVDLLLLDMIMDPGINGRETYEKIIKIHPGQKAIIVSGFAETSDVSRTQNLGAGKFVKKPLTLEKIGLAVREELMK